MNPETLAAVLIKVFGAYQVFYAAYDLLDVAIEKATDPHWNRFHYMAMWIGTRIILGLVLIGMARGLGRLLVKDLSKKDAS